MAAAIPFVMAASAVLSAVNAIQQGKAAKAAGEYNARVNEENAQLSRQEAQDLARQQDRENYLRLGTIRAAQGHSGGTTEGSALDILGEAAALGEEEKQRIIYQGELKARGYTNTATLDRFGGENAERASYMKAGSELLSGGANAYTSYTKLKRA